MLGFATVDLSGPDGTLTVWLTSAVGAKDAVHTNAVVFGLGDAGAPRRALGMAADRYLVLTGRTPRGHPALAGWQAQPCDVAMLADETMAAQNAVMAAFEAYRATPGKAGLMEPLLPPVPPPADEAALSGAAPHELALAVANQVMGTWRAWRVTERERVKRWRHMPGGREDETPSLLPPRFQRRWAVQPVRRLGAPAAAEPGAAPARAEPGAPPARAEPGP